jgi:tetratricopeptide (TPR) repeat protein
MRRHDGAPSATPTSTILADNDFRRRCLVIIARNAHRLPRWMIYAALCLTALAATIALTGWVYSPGLSGDFLFDDFGNLPVLGATGPVDNWATFWRYITSGNADPTGRPLPLLTFLIDAHNWPANPYPFKVTNVILHLINGALLAWVLWWLGKAIAIRHTSQNDIPPALRAGPLRSAGGENARWPAIAALFGAGAWLLHPLLVSTTLYIVQREAMLAATFVLLGTLGWIASRGALVHGHVRRALVGMALSAWFCTGLAVLSKANGALFPLELLLVEWIVLARQPMPDARTMRWHKRAVVAFLIIPSALVIAYLLYLLPGVVHGAAAVRGWTIGERLMTEPRVVTDYLRLLFIPHAHSSGLFNDAFPISTGWLHPASTIPCTALILALIGAGFALRKRHPATALALLFYFTAQLMESGWIPLELYYEHRNYLPAMLLFWPIGIGLARLRHLRWLGVLAAACILLALGVLTRQRATLWGDGFHQAQVWAAINPDSARAQANAALYDLSHDRPRLAAARLRLSLPKHPDDIQAPINLIGAECKLGAVQPQTFAAADHALANTRLGGTAAFKWFNDALGMATKHTCTGLDFAALQTTLDAARRNPHWQAVPGRQQDLAHLQGELDLAEGKPNVALVSFNRALTMQPNPGSALEQAAYLGSHGYPQLGLAHLDYYETLPSGPKPGIGMPRIHAWVLRKQGWWPKETAYLRQNLASDAATKTNAGKPSA